MEDIQSKEKFEKKVLKKSREKPVVVDFWAEWCLPCKKLGPKMEKAEEKTEDTEFYKVNIDELPEVAEDHGVKSIPNVILFMNGEEKDSFSGVMEPGDIAEWINENI